MFEIEEIKRTVAKIKVIGVGGAGTNAVNTMISSGLQGVDFIAVNTDIQHLEISLAPIKVQIGKELTGGRGTGSNSELGKKSAIENKDLLLSCIEGSDLVFITAGMGGGTGTGASPVIASLAKELGILTVSVVTKPFYFEGKKRLYNAVIGIKELKKYVDTIIVIPNDRIHMVVEKGTTLVKSFAIANDILRQAVQGISDLIISPGFINRDFADLKTIIQGSGKALIGLGSCTKQEGAAQAARKAINNPLLEETSIEGAKRILINITGGFDLTLDEVQDIAITIYDVANEDADIILGTVLKPEIENEIFVTVIATGFEDKSEDIELPENWIPKKSSILKETKRIISKEFSLFSSLTSSSSISNPSEQNKNAEVNFEKGQEQEDSVIFLKEPSKEIPSNIEEEIDIPAYLRKKYKTVNEKDS